MSTSDLKLDLIKAISDSNDLNFLKEIKNLFSYKKNDESVYMFNEWQQKRIELALKQYKNGEFISDEEAQIEIEKWFEEQEK